jgi:hypothetical protein
MPVTTDVPNVMMKWWTDEQADDEPSLTEAKVLMLVVESAYLKSIWQIAMDLYSDMFENKQAIDYELWTRSRRLGIEAIITILAVFRAGKPMSRTLKGCFTGLGEGPGGFDEPSLEVFLLGRHISGTSPHGVNDVTDSSIPESLNEAPVIIAVDFPVEMLYDLGSPAKPSADKWGKDRATYAPLHTRNSTPPWASPWDRRPLSM